MICTKWMKRNGHRRATATATTKIARNSDEMYALYTIKHIKIYTQTHNTWIREEKRKKTNRIFSALTLLFISDWFFVIHLFGWCFFHRRPSLRSFDAFESHCFWCRIQFTFHVIFLPLVAPFTIVSAFCVCVCVCMRIHKVSAQNAHWLSACVTFRHIKFTYYLEKFSWSNWLRWSFLLLLFASFFAFFLPLSPQIQLDSCNAGCC